MNINLWPSSWVCSVWISVGLGSVRSGPDTESFRSGPVLVFGLFGLAQCWSWVCSIWPRYWVFSVWRSVGLFGLAQCWPWVCSVWPRVTKVCSAWPTPEFGSVLSEPPVRDPSPSGPCLSWVADFILGNFLTRSVHSSTSLIYVQISNIIMAW